MSLRERLSKPQPLILDGALGTLLPDVSQSHPLWSTHTVLTSPSTIKSIHESYIKNGAQLIQTSTYQTSERGLNDSEFNVSFSDALKRSIDLAYEAKGGRDDVWLVGSVGPYGASLANGAEYTGDYGNISDEGLINFHTERISVLCNDDRVDIIGLETMPNKRELRILLELMDSYDKDYYLSLSVNGEKLADGTTIEELLELISKAERLIAAGVNCLSLQDSLEWLKKLKESEKILIVYPNSGEIYDGINKKWIENPNGSMSWKNYVQKLKAIGNVKIIGGCCRTTPNDIKQISDLVSELW